MTTPIVDFIKKYANDNYARFHMPGHKGHSFLGCEALDITEIDGADVLYMSDGIIKESEDNASSLFDTFATNYSTEGSSLAIRAMISGLSVLTAPRKPFILAARNAHKAFIYACATSDANVKWLYPAEFTHLCSCKITADDIKNALSECDTPPDAIYITSPDYLGNIADIHAISQVCDEHNILLMVDNAHGAYLHFLEENQHPVHLGAHVCCDSAHKTLPVLTGGAYLHFAENCPADYVAACRNMLKVYASTSPSYLILQSLDLCNQYLANNYKSCLHNTVALTNSVKTRLCEMGFKVENTEPLKIVINISDIDVEALHEALRKHKVSPEMCDDSYIVFMITPENTSANFDSLLVAFGSLLPLFSREKAHVENTLAPVKHKAVMSIRQAVFAKHMTLPIEDSIGKICASPTISCPPAVPVVVSGEVITHEDYLIMKKNSIHFIDTVLE